MEGSSGTITSIAGRLNKMSPCLTENCMEGFADCATRKAFSHDRVSQGFTVTVTVSHRSILHMRARVLRRRTDRQPGTCLQLQLVPTDGTLGTRLAPPHASMK
jgi:hypothetical protein